MDKPSGLLGEFKKFIMRGNVLDLAVGIVVGSAFVAVVNSFVNDVLMPPIGLLLGGLDFVNIFVVFKEGATPGPYLSLDAAKAAGAVTWRLGLFVNTIIGFLIVAGVVFLVVKAVSRFMPKKEAPAAAPATKECPYCATQIPLKASRCPNCTSQLQS